MMKKLLCLLCALMLLSGSAMAVSKVTYEGGAEKFVFLPGSEYSDSDLFENFKNVVPGDVLTQRIMVKNNADSRVRLYMRVDPVSEKDRDFLSRLNIQISCRNQEIFDAAASETAQLTENTLLGTFKRAGSTELIVTLTVPLDLDNTYMNAIGTVPWTFLVEEIPDSDSPDTGDRFELSTWLISGGMILLAIAVVLVQMKRRKTAN